MSYASTLQKKDMAAISFGLGFLVVLFVQVRAQANQYVSRRAMIEQPNIVASSPEVEVASELADSPADKAKTAAAPIGQEELADRIADALRKRGVVVAFPEGKANGRMVFVNKLPLFRLGGSKLTTEGHLLVRSIGATLMKLHRDGQWSLTIFGHTDAKPFLLMRGPYYNNDELSEARALHAKEAMEKSCGRARIECLFEMKAMSFRQPWSSDAIDDVNRRFDVTIKWFQGRNP